ncbi:MAG: DUF92 domain-containing protein [Euryarchaeota archaeon]|nr:DUF92 domain-containing protein [Euryarchaeota archaeon]
MAALLTGDIKLAVELAIVAVFSFLAFKKRMLTLSASFVAFLLGAAIVYYTNIFWVLLIISLLGITVVATKYKYAEKKERGVAERKGGVRRIRNVLANGLMPAIVAVLYPVIVGQYGLEGPDIAALTFVSTIAVAASDTLASELGSLSDEVYMITTLKRVPPGTDGGVSVPGTTAAFIGAFTIAFLGIVLLGVIAPLFTLTGVLKVNAFNLIVPTLVGFIGCQIDSLLGAFLELEGMVNKEEVNLISIAAGTVLAFTLGALF